MSAAPQPEPGPTAAQPAAAAAAAGAPRRELHLLGEDVKALSFVRKLRKRALTRRSASIPHCHVHLQNSGPSHPPP